MTAKLQFFIWCKLHREWKWGNEYGNSEFDLSWISGEGMV